MSYLKLILLFAIILLFPLNAMAEGEQLDSIQQLIDVEQDPEKQFMLYSAYLEELKKTDRAATVEYNHKRLKIAKGLMDNKKISETLRSLGNNYLYVNNNDSSLYYYELALPIYENAFDSAKIVTILGNKALILQRTNQYEEATKLYHDISVKAHKIKKYDTAIVSLINVASLQLNQNNPSLAIDYLLRAKHIKENIHQDSVEVLKTIEEMFEPMIYINLGLAYESKFEITNDSTINLSSNTTARDSAIIYYNQALKIIDQIENEYNATYTRSYVYDNLGSIYKNMGQWDKALKNLNNALKGFEDIQNNQGLVFTKVDIGSVLTKLKKYDQAETILLEGLAGAIEFDITEEISDAYKYLSENYRAKNDFKTSVFFLEKHITYRDSLLNSERITAIQDMETKYETDRIEQEKILAEKDAALAEQQKKQQLILFLIGLTGVIAASVIGYSRYKLRQERKSAEYERNLNVAMSRFVPTEFIESIGRDKITEVQLGDMKEKEVTVIFTDIRNFTSRSEKMTPTHLFEFVRDYAQAMGPIIQKNGGFINQYLGDGLMAIFQNSPEDALRACVQMHERLVTYNEDLQKLGVVPIQVGMGLHTGPAVMGIIGDDDRRDATMISDTVNTAARMESKTKQYGVKILISEESRIRLENPDLYHLRHIGDVKVKGKEHPIDIYECFNPDDPSTINIKLQSKPDFDLAVNAFMNQKFAEAKDLFGSIIDKNEHDMVSISFIDQIDEITSQLDNQEKITSMLIDN